MKIVKAKGAGIVEARNYGKENIYEEKPQTANT